MKINTYLQSALLLGTAVSTSAFSNENKPFNGAYIGATVGVERTSSSGPFLSDSKTEKQTNLQYGGLMGVRGQVAGKLLLGLEGNFTKLSYKSQRESFSHQWAVSGLIGLVFGTNNRNLLFAKVGTGKARMKDLQDINNKNLNDGIMVFGGGYERKLTDTIGLRAEAEFTGALFGHDQYGGKLSVTYNF